MSINKNLIQEIIKYRASELDELSSHIKENNRIWWYDERRQGKKSIVKQLIKQNPSWKMIYLDLFPILNIHDFINKYATTLAQELFKELKTIPEVVKESNKYFKSFYPLVTIENEQINVVLKLEKELSIGLAEVISAPQRYQDQNKKETVCVIFNDFQQISEISIDLVNHFAQNLEEQEIPYIFLSSQKRKIEDFFTDPKSFLYNRAQRFVMKALTEAEWRLLIIQAFSSNNQIVPQKVVNLIVECSQCKSYYIFLFCNKIESLIKEEVDLNLFPEKFIFDLIEEEESFFKDIFDSLTPNQKKSILILARTKGENFYKSQITEEYAINKSSLERSVQSLEQNNLVVKTQRGTLQFKNPILRSWLLKKFN